MKPLNYMKSKPIDELKKRLLEISDLSSALGLLNWDRDVYMPVQGENRRAASIAQLSSIIHNKFISIDSDHLLTNLKKQLDTKKLKGDDIVIVAETWRIFDRERKLTEQFVSELALTTSKAQGIWVEARKKNDFKLFLPWLTKIINLKRQEAEYVGYAKSPYDALIDTYEPGMTAEKASQILKDLKDFLIPFLKEIKSSKIKINSKIIEGDFPLDKQIEFNEMIVKAMGFDLTAGRIDTTTHPFAMGLHPQDVRITTRYLQSDLLYSLGSIIHEAGHGLYEQGLPSEHFGTPLAETVSLGIHESQSRMWENLIGKSRPFWKYFYPILQRKFPIPFEKVSFDKFYAILNLVQPSPIRTEADEVTYNLHVILRFEIEKEMIEGSIDLKQLPKIWRAKMKEYFGINVPTDAPGVLQDVHWSAGLIGYFPTYSFGNLYSAQFFTAMRKDIPDIDEKMSRGEFKEIRNWLKKHIHAHGKTYTADRLVEKVTGEPLQSKYFIDYLRSKFL